MSRITLPDGDWIIRVIVMEKDKNEVPQFIWCRIKDGVIPSEQKTIAYLAKREGYKEGTRWTRCANRVCHALHLTNTPSRWRSFS